MIRTLLFSACAAAAMTVTASAVIMNITIDSAGNPLNGTGTADSTEANIPPNDGARNLAFLNNEVSLWNAINTPDLPVAVGPVALDQGSLDGLNFYTAVAGYEYVVFHFGNGRAGGSTGGWSQAWYLGGASGNFSVPTVNGLPVGGFSSARYFNPGKGVPDGGMTIAMLGMAVIALDALRRKLAAA